MSSMTKNLKEVKKPDLKKRAHRAKLAAQRETFYNTKYLVLCQLRGTIPADNFNFLKWLQPVIVQTCSLELRYKMIATPQTQAGIQWSSKWAYEYSLKLKAERRAEWYAKIEIPLPF
jgi:hypothetical protein